MSKPLLYDYFTDSGELKELESLIYARLVDLESKEIKKAVAEIFNFYQSLDNRAKSVSDDDLRLIVIIYYHMHNSLVRIIRRQLILDWRELMRTRDQALPMKNPEEEVPLAVVSGGESKLDDNSFFLNSLKSWEKLPDNVISNIRDLAGGDCLSGGVRLAAMVDLQILRNVQFLLKQLIALYEARGDPNGPLELAQKIDKLIANYKVLGFDTSEIGGSALVVGTRKLRF